MYNFVSGTKRHILARYEVIYRSDRKNWCMGLGSSEEKHPQKLTSRLLCTRPTEPESGGACSETPYQIVIKFCTGVGVLDFITCAKVGGHRLGGFGYSFGQISFFH